MPYAFMHLVPAWLLGKLYEKARGKQISLFGWFLLLLGAILPDIDYLFEWTFDLRIHRLFTHSFMMAVFVFAIAFLLFKLLSNTFLIEKKNALLYTFCITSGVVIHLALDFIVSPIAGIPLFWPSTGFYGLFSGIQQYSQVFAIQYTAPLLYLKLRIAILDMSLGVAWLFYLIYSKKIRGF